MNGTDGAGVTEEPEQTDVPGDNEVVTREEILGLAAVGAELTTAARRFDLSKTVQRRQLYGFAAIILAVVIAASTVIIVITKSTNHVVRQEIPGFKAQISERDQTIATRNQTISDQQDELQQAVAAIRKLAAGWDTAKFGPIPQISISPPKH